MGALRGASAATMPRRSNWDMTPCSPASPIRLPSPALMRPLTRKRLPARGLLRSCQHPSGKDKNDPFDTA